MQKRNRQAKQTIPGQEAGELGHRNFDSSTCKPQSQGYPPCPWWGLRGLSSLCQLWFLACLHRWALSTDLSECTQLKWLPQACMAFDVYMAYMPLIQSTQHYLIADCVFLNLNSGKVSSWMRPVYGLVPFESNITLRTIKYGWRTGC